MPRYPDIPKIELPLLITGVAGVSGYNAFKYYYEKYPGQVIGTRREEYWPLSGDGIVGCDITNKESIVALCQQYTFRSVINCLGTCKLKFCELDPIMAHRVNVQSLDNLVSALQQSGCGDATMIHHSVDLVFSGKDAGKRYTELDTPDPVTVYGKTMVEAEHILLDRLPQATILRISLPMGPSFSGHAGAIDWIQSRFKNNKPATLYYDEIRMPQYTDCLNKLTNWLLTHPLAGIYHAGGVRQLSLFQIAQIVNRVGGYEPSCLIGCPRIDAGPMPPRAGDVSLDSSRLQTALGFVPFDPWPLQDKYVPVDRSWHLDPANAPADSVIKGSLELLNSVLYNNPER
jgi:dTDP-4-dehydrorhamnose reductase